MILNLVFLFHSTVRRGATVTWHDELCCPGCPYSLHITSKFSNFEKMKFFFQWRDLKKLKSGKKYSLTCFVLKFLGQLFIKLNSCRKIIENAVPCRAARLCWLRYCGEPKCESFHTSSWEAVVIASSVYHSIKFACSSVIFILAWGQLSF